MLDSYFLIEAMNGVHDKHLVMVGEMLGYYEKGKPVHVHRKLVSTILVAAVIISLFTLSAYALYWSLRGTATHRMPETGK